MTVDVTVPVLTIDGGAARSTSDASPWTYGTTAEKAGTFVHVSVGGQTLTGTVQPGGTRGESDHSRGPGEPADPAGDQLPTCGTVGVCVGTALVGKINLAATTTQR